MSAYVPNTGERELLKNALISMGVVLGIYKNQVIPDGTMTMDTLQELTSGGGEGYAQIALTNLINESAPASGQWYISTDANGNASAQYGLAAAPQAWTFNAQDVADAETVFGIFAFTWVLPFDNGAKQIKVGDTILGAAGATGIVTAVEVQSGSWGAGTAAGNLKIMTKTGTFVDSEVITKKGAVATVDVIAAGTGYAVGDIIQITQAGGSGVKLVVTAIGGGGSVSSVVVVEGGMGYALADALPTTHLTGAGNDALTVDIETLATTTYATVNIGTVGDALKELLWVEAQSSGTLIANVGQQVTYLPIFTSSTQP